jgi:hypothetical protein
MCLSEYIRCFSKNLQRYWKGFLETLKRTAEAIHRAVIAGDTAHLGDRGGRQGVSQTGKWSPLGGAEVLEGTGLCS